MARLERRGARRRWSRRRCCATWRSRTSAAAAATGPRASRRRTGSDVVAAALAPQREALARAVEQPAAARRRGRRCGPRATPAGAADAARNRSLAAAARATLSRLYPDAPRAGRRRRYAPDCSRSHERTVASAPWHRRSPRSTSTFDFSSPYSYIASEWIEALAARHGRTVHWKAILLGVDLPGGRAEEPGEPSDQARVLAARLRALGALRRRAASRCRSRFPIATQNAARLFWWLHDERAGGGVAAGPGTACAPTSRAATSTSPTRRR